MEAYEFILLAAILGVVAVDAIIRLHVAPARRDPFVGQLLGAFVARENSTRDSLVSPGSHKVMRERSFA